MPVAPTGRGRSGAEALLEVVVLGQDRPFLVADCQNGVEPGAERVGLDPRPELVARLDLDPVRVDLARLADPAVDRHARGHLGRRAVTPRRRLGQLRAVADDQAGGAGHRAVGAVEVARRDEGAGVVGKGDLLAQRSGQVAAGQLDLDRPAPRSAQREQARRERGRVDSEAISRQVVAAVDVVADLDHAEAFGGDDQRHPAIAIPPLRLAALRDRLALGGVDRHHRRDRCADAPGFEVDRQPLAGFPLDPEVIDVERLEHARDGRPHLDHLGLVGFVVRLEFEGLLQVVEADHRQVRDP